MKWAMAGVSIPQTCAFLCALVVSIFANPVGVQAQAVAPGERIIILASEELRSMAEGLSRGLARRGVRATLGEAPPEIPEAVRFGELAIVHQDDGTLWLGTGGRGGRTITTTIDFHDDAGMGRSLALAAEMLLEEAAELPPESDTASRAGEWVFLDYERPRPRRSLATPTVFFRMLLGVSTQRGTALVGPGAGVGLCVSNHCVTFEADLPLIADSVDLGDGNSASYRAITAALRVHLRPLVIGRWSLGISTGFLTRIGTITVASEGIREVSTSLGVRSSLETAFRIAGPLELLLEAGVDLAIPGSEARLNYAAGPVRLEDRWTPWLVGSLVIRAGSA